MREEGVLEQSKIYFHTPSPFAKEALYYVTSGGDYVCSSNYKTNRNYFEQLLFIYVKQGKMEIYYEKNLYIAQENSLIILDCHRPHLYRALEETTFEWLHFKGSASSAYFDLLHKTAGCIFPLHHNLLIPDYMNQLLTAMKNNNVEEHKVSVLIHQLWYELELLSKQSRKDSFDQVIRHVILYMENHFMENLDLYDLATFAQLSPYHFSRKFKKHTNLSPKQYLIHLRITFAKELLYFTDMPIYEVAFECGFNSVSHFVTTFKKYTNLTPKQFRKFKV